MLVLFRDFERIPLALGPLVTARCLQVYQSVAVAVCSCAMMYITPDVH